MRSTLERVIALAVGCVLAVVAAEIGLRVLDRAPTAGVATVTSREFARVPGLFKPNQEVVDRRIPALEHDVVIDSLGYRGEHFERAKPGDEFRVLMIGDSFTYGDYVGHDQTLPDHLQRALNPMCGNVNVINAGVGGSTIVTHTRMAERALPLDPDAVVLTFSENDVTDLIAPIWSDLADNRRQKSKFPLSIAYPMLRNTALWNFALDIRARLNKRKVEEQVAGAQTAAQGADTATASSRRRLRRRYAEGLFALRDSLVQRGVPLVFVAYPSHHTVDQKKTPEQIRWAVQTAGDADLMVVDLLPVLRGTGLALEDLYLLPHDGHPSPTGYRIAGRAIAQALREHETLASRCRGGVADCDGCPTEIGP